MQLQFNIRGMGGCDLSYSDHGMVVGGRWATLKKKIITDFLTQQSGEFIQNVENNKKLPCEKQVCRWLY